MIDAGKLNPENPSDMVQFGDLWYGVAGTEHGRVLFTHECPDGTVIEGPSLEPWCDLWTAGERLAELRGELVDDEEDIEAATSSMRANRGRSMFWTAASVRLHEAREKRDRVQAQIDELVDMGVTETVWLGPEKCPTCRGRSTVEGSGDICPDCAGSGVNHG